MAVGAPNDLGQGQPWEELRALGGRAQIDPNDSTWTDGDFEALR